uniref:Polysaccharide biosynthesis protein n=1 Tax=Desulfobacca acetoxidans TaxID=60893 RepID=A0A7V4LD34_9BACT
MEQSAHAGQVSSHWLTPLVKYRIFLILAVNLGFFSLAYISSYLLRFDFLLPEEYYGVMLRTLPLVVLLQGLLFYYYDLFQGLWRFVSFEDLVNIVEATVLSQIFLANVNYFTQSWLGRIPLSIYFLDCLILIGLVGGSRMAVRYGRQRWLSPGRVPRPKSTIVVGPVQVAEPLVREMLRHPEALQPLALLDPLGESPGCRIHDILIIKGLQNAVALARRHGVQEFLVAWPEAPEEELTRLMTAAHAQGIKVKVVPSLPEVLAGKTRRIDIRDLDLLDLLHRPPVQVESDRIAGILRDRSILVSGGAGSIGSEISRQAAAFGPRTLILLDRAENSLLELEMALRRRFPDLKVVALVGSVNDREGVLHLCQEHRPEIIFHAAAYKHVPLMERAPLEAVYNNILGTRNLLQAALAAGAEKFVLISTDKAVNPTNIMGVSKAIAERYVQSINGVHPTRVVITRFGNVLGSAGSVIPLFQEQLLQGGPLTITHPEIERFFMTIPEAVQLVLQAAAMGEGGDVFVLNMGRSVKIRELAEKLILLAGKTPGKDIQMVYTGLRPGEKLYEELFNADEKPQPTAHPMILRATRPPDPPEVWEEGLAELEALVRRRDVAGVLARFQTLVPTYTPFEGGRA